MNCLRPLNASIPRWNMREKSMLNLHSYTGFHQTIFLRLSTVAHIVFLSLRIYIYTHIHSTYINGCGLRLRCGRCLRLQTGALLTERRKSTDLNAYPVPTLEKVSSRLKSTDVRSPEPRPWLLVKHHQNRYKSYVVCPTRSNST